MLQRPSYQSAAGEAMKTMKYYRSYHSGAAQTLKSIQISLIARLEKFNLPSLAGSQKCPLKQPLGLQHADTSAWILLECGFSGWKSRHEARPPRQHPGGGCAAAGLRPTLGAAEPRVTGPTELGPWSELTAD